MHDFLPILVGVLCGAHAAGASAVSQRYNSSSSISPTTAPASSCEASCTIEYPQIKVLQWIPIQSVVYSTTLTAATLVYVVNNRTNTTSTLTEYNQLPDGYTAPASALNSDGKVVSTVTLPLPNGAALTTAITYPTEFLDYAPSYEWLGVLPTRTLSHSTCVTISSSTSPYSTPLATLSSHPIYPQPTTASFPSDNTTDTVGTAHMLAWASTFDAAAPIFYKSAFPDEAAFTACNLTLTSLPTVLAHTTARYLTERTTRYTNGIDSGPSKPTSAPAPHTEQTVSESAGTPIAITQPNLGPGPTPQNTGPAPQQQTPNVGSAIASIIANNPSALPSALPASPAPPAPPAQPTPTPTYIPTIINGVSTTVPAYVIGTQTAAAGATVTMNGTPVVLSAPAVVTGTTSTLGGYIISGLSGSLTTGKATATVSGVVQFTGAAGRVGERLRWVAVMGAGVGVVGWL